MDYQIQAKKVDKYSKPNYLTPRRWSSYATQVREVMLLKPQRILEIGPGNNIIRNILKDLGYTVETLDLDQRIAPDHLGSVTDESIIDTLAERFDLVLACQIFEHLLYKDYLKTMRSLMRVAPKIVLSLPYTEINSKLFNFTMKIPGLERISRTFKIIYRPVEHNFNGEHYWEIGKRGYPLKKIKRDLEAIGWTIDKNFLNPDNPFHYFLVLSLKL